MAERVVVVGADAAGMSAASQALRVGRQHGRDLDVVALERGTHTSYSACGIPYWVGGEVGSVEALIARTPEQHRANGIDVRLRTEATELDLDRREVEVRDHAGGSTYRLGFDQLVLATGARPRRPQVPGVDAAGIHGVQTLDDGERLLDSLEHGPRRAVVVGGGYIGIEMAEAMVHRGLSVTVLTRSAEPMATLDPDMGGWCTTRWRRWTSTCAPACGCTAFDTDGAGRVRAVDTDDGRFEADLVVLGTGVEPETSLAAGGRAAARPAGRAGHRPADAGVRRRRRVGGR